MFTGVPSLFIRFSGCNLRCSWCDSMFTSWKPELKPMELEDLFKTIAGSKSRHVVVTGGEPMLYREELRQVIGFCESVDKPVTVETNGTVWDDTVRPLLWSVSPKLGSSVPAEMARGERALHLRNNRFPMLPAFADRPAPYRVQYKFVICGAEDMGEVDGIVRGSGLDPATVWLMPEGTDAATVLARSEPVIRYAQQRGYNFSTRLHTLVWGPRRGV